MATFAIFYELFRDAILKYFNSQKTIQMAMQGFFTKEN